VYVNHWHEVAVGEPVEPTAPLFVHAGDRERVARTHHIRGAFSTRHTLDDDFEVIPTPGHTPGATAYLWDTGERRLLFTGDTLYLRDGDWVAAVLDSSDRPSYIESLKLIRELDFDVLVPWAHTVDQPYFALTDGEDTRRRIDAILDRLAAGGDG
jgi:glyoxylase-like metal-dependent hydrolase (beta-lactamase superfamily II)